MQTAKLTRLVAQLSVFDLGGRWVAAVRAPAGDPLEWDGTDNAGRPLPVGVYLYRVDIGSLRKSGKIVIVR